MTLILQCSQEDIRVIYNMTSFSPRLKYAIFLCLKTTILGGVVILLN